MKQNQWNKIAAKITTGYLVCMVSIYLLYFGVKGYAGISNSKWALFLLLSAGYLGVLLIIRVELFLVGAAPVSSPRFVWQFLNFPQKILCLLWLTSAVSTLLAVNRTTALFGSSRHEGFLTITIYIGCCLMVSLYGELRTWMLWLFASAISLNCILALLQLAGLNPFNLYPGGMNYYDKYELYAGEFLGTIGNVDLLSAVLCIAIPLFWIFLVEGKDVKKWILCIPIGLCLTVLFCASVSAGIVAVCTNVLLTIPVLQKTHKARIITGVTMLLLCILGVVVVYLFGSQIGGFIYEASELMHGHCDDNFGSGRLYIWKETMALIPQHPLFGCGPDTLGLQTDAAFERMNETVGAIIHSQVDNAHNEYLNMLVERGSVTLAIYIALLFSCVQHWIKEASHRPITALCGGAVLAYCIQAFFGLSSPVSAPYFWITLGGLIGTTAIHSTNKNTKGVKKNVKR